jgi:hypothetical protein
MEGHMQLSDLGISAVPEKAPENLGRSIRLGRPIRRTQASP